MSSETLRLHALIQHLKGIGAWGMAESMERVVRQSLSICSVCRAPIVATQMDAHQDCMATLYDQANERDAA